VDQYGVPLGVDYSKTDPQDYEGSIQNLADKILEMAEGRQITTGSIAIAAAVDENGRLTQSGALTPWIGRRPGVDLAQAMNLPEGLVGVNNDAAVLALSQIAINKANGREADGVASTLSSGWGNALYTKDGEVFSREWGHCELRAGATCPCDGADHAEAFISGNGVQLNKGKSMEEWLKTPGAPQELITDISTAVIERITEERENGLSIEELRWTGGIALHHPLIMNAVTERMRRYMGSSAPAVDTLTMGDQAGLHGTWIDARRIALAA
jgi:predicted NBD/HSP70 family sugar kinase